MEPIIVIFTQLSTGRIEFEAEVMTSDRKSLDTVTFKMDTASDFTTLSYDDLKLLGYKDDFLYKCSVVTEASTAGGRIELRYIDNVSIKIGNRELQGCRIFFSLRNDLRSLFGSDILKYFNYSVNFDIDDTGEIGEFKMQKTIRLPQLSNNERQIYIYSLSKNEDIEY